MSYHAMLNAMQWADLFVLIVLLCGIFILLMTSPHPDSPLIRHFLPEQSEWDSVMVGHRITRSPLKSLTCPHTVKVKYRRVDHRTGPGAFATSYEGECCTDCGMILTEKEV